MPDSHWRTVRVFVGVLSALCLVFLLLLLAAAIAEYAGGWR